MYLLKRYWLLKFNTYVCIKKTTDIKVINSLIEYFFMIFMGLNI